MTHILGALMSDVEAIIAAHKGCEGCPACHPIAQAEAALTSYDQIAEVDERDLHGPMPDLQPGDVEGWGHPEHPGRVR